MTTTPHKPPPMEAGAIEERRRWVEDYERRERELDAQRGAKEPRR